MTRPALRGVSHGLAALACLPGAWALFHHARVGQSQLAALIYMLGIFGIFVTSAVYHRVEWTEEGLARMRRLDHGMIYFGIAGFYTPFCFCALTPAHGQVMFLLAWFGAAAGVLRVIVWSYAPRWVAVGSYALQACLALPFLGEMLANVGPWGNVLMWTGNAVVGLGAMCYAAGKPDPWPGVFGHHEIFHLTVVVVAACYYGTAWMLVGG
ncbi:MAG: rane protein [Cyanobacteria bacterium RYN_339]|nr:rane protein [Cyanobacteria bacterium RYN_339]